MRNLRNDAIKNIEQRAMKKLYLEIVGLRYHEYKECLEELYDMVIGQMVSLMPEEGNGFEVNAVAVYLGTKRLGYVCSDQRRIALAALRLEEADVLFATVVSVDRERKHLQVLLEVSDTLQPDRTEEVNVLTDWVYSGPKLIRNGSEYSKLNCCVATLTKLLKGATQWTEMMEVQLCGIERLLVHDISKEMDDAIIRLNEMLTALSTSDGRFAEAAVRLQYADCEVASDEGCELMAVSIRDLANCSEMNKLLERLGDEAPTVAAQLPAVLLAELHSDLGKTLSRIRYWRQPRSKVQPVRCLMALSLRLEQQGVTIGHRTADDDLIPDALADWADGDEERTQIVERIAKDRLLQSAAPAVKQKLKRLRASCCKPMPAAQLSPAARRQQALEYMNELIRKAIADNPNNRKLILLPYVAAIRAQLLPNTMTVDAFNAQYGTKIKPSTFSSYVPKDIDRSDISEVDTAAIEKEFLDML